MSAWAMPASCGGVGERAGEELHRPPGAGGVRRAATRVPAVIGLDPPDRRQHLPVEPEARRCLLVQGEVRGRDVGDRGRIGAVRRDSHGPAAGEDADRRREEQDRESEQDQGAAAAGARDPHEVSGGADLSGFDGPRRSAARVVSAAYSRSATTASKAVWLRPTNSRPSPGRAWSSERRSAGVRSK